MTARPLVTALALLALLAAPAPVRADPSIGGSLLKTDVFAGPAAFAHATTDGARWDARLGGFRLADTGKAGYARTGAVALPMLHYGAGFNRVVPSWNADCPPGTFVAIELQASPDSGKTWSKWLQLARWGDEPAIQAAASEPVDKLDEIAKINEDTFEIKQGKADRLRMRVTLRSERADVTPLVTLVGLTVADKTQPAPAPDDARSTAWGKEIATDFRSQGWEQPDMSYRICGPTSTTMMLTAHGIKLPTAAVARECWDETNGIYGNWPFIAAGASDLMRKHADQIPAKPGKRKVFRSWVSWAPDWKQVEQEVLAGNPVVVSIRFKEGELKRAPIKSTAGHLILVKGFTKDGDPIVHDPAAKSAKAGRIVYDRQELHRARHGGPVIVFHPYE